MLRRKLHQYAFASFEAARPYLTYFWILLAKLVGASNAWLLDLEGLLLADYFGKYDRAVAKFRKALSLDPKTSSYKYNLAIALARTGNVREALELGKELLLVENVPASYAQTLGSDLAKAGAHAAALEWFDLAISKNSSLEAAKLGQAHCYLNLKKTYRALEQYRELATTASEDWIRIEAELAIPKALYDLGEQSEALEAAERLSKNGLASHERDKLEQLINWLRNEKNRL